MNDIKALLPNELKTIEVDVQKKIFKVNGQDFGKGCTYFSIFADAENRSDGFYNIYMDMHRNVKVSAVYDEDGTKRLNYEELKTSKNQKHFYECFWSKLRKKIFQKTTK